MIFVVFSLFCGFGLVIWLSYRRVRRGEVFAPDGRSAGSSAQIPVHQQARCEAKEQRERTDGATS